VALWWCEGGTRPGIGAPEGTHIPLPCHVKDGEKVGSQHVKLSSELRGGRAMGRGRAKAKQTKVARRLKYSTPQMDLDALREELSGDTGSESVHQEREDYFEDDDRWSPPAEDEDDNRR
jgi:hypothetical protein